MNIVHLHTHSDYSLLDGLAKINQLVAKSKKLGMKALALTDHGVMYGAIKFYKACKEIGLKPIVGCEVYISPRKRTDKEAKVDAKPHHLTLLAKNYEGYKNLVKIVSESHLVGFYYKPRVDLEFLEKYSQGIICLSGCPVAQIPRAVQEGDMGKATEIAKRYINIFGKENFFFEIQPHKMAITQKTNAGIVKLAKDFNIPLVATNDIHYLNHDDKKAHEVLLAVNTGKDLEDSERMSLDEADLFMMSYDEMLEALPEHKEALAQSEVIADLIDLEIPFGEHILPKFPLEDGISAQEYLLQKALTGFEARYASKANLTSKLDPQVDPSARLAYELDVIEKTGFADYFLIVSDFVTWAKDNGIGVGPGRGSAAGSIVSYCLNITDLDPIRYDLLFERFLNPERIAMPDIDLDFDDERRGEVIEHIKKTYGDDHVAQIITFGVMKARLAVRDVARSMGYPYEIGDKIAKLIPIGSTLEDAIKSVVDLQRLSREDPSVKAVVEMSYKLEGVARHASTHAAGIVISKDPLVEYVPLQRSTTGTKEGVTTQYDMVDVESIGLLKIDILGLANLTIIKNALRIIRKTENKIIDIKNIPLDDKKTFQLLSRGDTIGVFQLESDGMRHYIKELKPTQIEDIMAMVSLYRPGPIELIPDYIAGKHHKRKITYLHPGLEPILKDTYGIAVYQEQILQIARSLAGFSYGEADVLRKAIGKKIRSLLLQQRKKFIDGAIANGIDNKTAEKIFDFAEPFARYGFNRAHAASYALIAYQTAYLKAHFPHSFMAALLTSEHKNLDKVAIAISEAERMNIHVLPPEINESFVEFGVVPSPGLGVNLAEKIIRFGLGAVKNVGEKAGELIVEERNKNGKYKSLEDLLVRIGGQTINKKIIESLAKSGALDTFYPRNQILGGIEEILKYSQNWSIKRPHNQSDLFGDKLKIEPGKLTLPSVSLESKKQRLAWEKEFLGIYLSDHPLKDYVGELKEINASNISQINESQADKTVRIAGIINSAKKITTKSSQSMAFISLEDLTGSLEVIVFPSVLEENMEIWDSHSPIVVDGRISLKDGAIKIIANRVYNLGDKILPLAESKASGNGGWNNHQQNNVTARKNGNNKLTLLIPKHSDKNILSKIKDIVRAFPGEKQLVLLIPQNGGYQTINSKTKVSDDQKLVDKLRELIGKGNVK